jgi:putative ABC transport system permease protein
MFKSLMSDLRYAARILRKRPGFTLVAVATLALGIGANSAIFSVVHTVLLRPLPFGQPESLVRIWETRPDRGWMAVSLSRPNFRDYRDQNRTLEDVGAYSGTSLNLTGLGFPERVSASRISAGFFRLLRADPVLGRTFQPGEDEPGNENRVALLSYEFWRTRFSADSSIVGSSLTLDDQSFTVVGVLPPGSPWLDAAQVFVPLVRDPETDRQNFMLATIGRLAPGVSIETASSDLEAIARRLQERYPELESHGPIGIRMSPASTWIATDGVRRALWILLGAVGFLLLIACVNLANLLLARATSRQRETAVRAALGAMRGRIIRQMLAESLLLGVAGVVVGLAIAVWAIGLLKTLNPGDIPRLGEVGLNPLVLGFTLVVGLLAAVLAGLVPAFQVHYSDILASLREGDRGMAGSRGRRRLRNVLVGAEVALSLILLLGAGLLIRSFDEVMRVDRGFETDNRTFFTVNLPPSYEEGTRTSDFIGQLLARLDSRPGVLASAAVSARPIVGGHTGMGIVPAERGENVEGDVPWAVWRIVTGDYFRTVGLPLLRGRTFTEVDKIGEPWRIVISQRLAELLWPGEDPIGRHAVLWAGQDGFPGEVIGVVGDMRERGLESDPTLAVYLPFYGAGWTAVNFVLHTAGDAAPLIGSLRPIVAELDASLPVSNIQGLDEIVDNSLATRRFNMLLLLAFAGLALILALAGIYGVQSYTVARRTSEIGIRVALGASGTTIVRHIVGQGMIPVLVGIALGSLGAFGLSRLMSSLLFGVDATDFTTFFAVAVALGLTALIASYLPARRALRVDAVTALREE